MYKSHPLHAYQLAYWILFHEFFSKQATKTPLVNERYKLRRYICYKIIDPLTAWVNKGWDGKRPIIVWNAGKQNKESMHAVKCVSCVLLPEKELLNLRNLLESRAFTRLVRIASTLGNVPQKIKLARRMSANNCHFCIRVCGIIVTFSQGKTLYNVSIAWLIVLMHSRKS